MSFRLVSTDRGSFEAQNFKTKICDDRTVLLDLLESKQKACYENVGTHF